MQGLSVLWRLTAFGAVVGLWRYLRHRDYSLTSPESKDTVDIAEEEVTPAQFFADKDADGLIRINLRYIDTFLRWGCGRELLAMGLYPNAKEISESMGCLENITKHLPELKLTDENTVAVVSAWKTKFC